MVLRIIAYRPPGRGLDFHGGKFLSNSSDNRSGDRLSLEL